MLRYCRGDLGEDESAEGSVDMRPNYWNGDDIVVADQDLNVEESRPKKHKKLKLTPPNRFSITRFRCIFICVIMFVNCQRSRLCLRVHGPHR